MLDRGGAQIKRESPADRKSSSWREWRLRQKTAPTKAFGRRQSCR